MYVNCLNKNILKKESTPEYLHFGTDRCCIVFVENRKSLGIQIGRPKFVKFAYFSETFRFCSDFQTEYIFF